ncbi:hypothetical protein [Microbulbifer spongiae]|uniref:Uncharacterized protein n=1 Tax=Microbulbifer spongiae TaxID=2944933 RepID=A0ABY9EFC4_9GAMM|nr:hypothetical protein [Microbulbifer sp. MI-G]WKD51101.1 hypothetical protein M8T91_06670 [Microbulbifer sp. MI-G]
MFEHTTTWLQADAEPILGRLQDIKGSLSAFEVLKAPLEILNSLANLGDLSLKLRCINLDTGSTGAIEMLVVFEPSEPLFLLAAALWTQKIEGTVVDQ